MTDYLVSTISRWNSIPMERESAPSNKRSRSMNENDGDDDNSSDDNVSLVSRSPSPQPERDVEMKNVDLYDEHIRGAAREVITIETRIKSSNRGFAMLAKMGWTEGKPLGLSGDGRVDPVPFTVKQDSTGLGKYNQDFRMIETTVAQRRNLESERMQFETTEQRIQREASVAQKAAVKDEITTVLRPFYCELCDKQFQNVAQYDEHTNSYAHHHKARIKDMNANHPLRVGGREEAERRKEKERKREEKELRKLAKAAGIKLTTAPTASINNETKDENKGFKKSGWATVSSAPSPPSSGPRGWASVSSPAPPSTSRSSGWQSVGAALPAPPDSAPPPIATSGGLGFRSGGWSTLATSSPAPSPSSPAPPPPDQSSSLPTPPPLPSGSAPPPPPPSEPRSSWTPVPPVSNRWDAKPKGAHQSDKRKDDSGTRKGNWQSFQKMKGRR